MAGAGGADLDHVVEAVECATNPPRWDALLARVRPRRLPGSRSFNAVMTAPRSQDLARLARLVDEGRLRVPVDSVHAMVEADLAHRRAESHLVGRVLVVTAHGDV